MQDAESLGERDAHAVESFLDSLRHELAAKRAIDVYLSSDFNVFRYIDTDENTLSDIVADLLDSDGVHGQGREFVQSFLDLIGKRELAGLTARASREVRTTTVPYAAKRRIDVVVVFGNQQFCVAIENKPHAPEQPNWVRDYSAELRKRFGERSILVYLSGRGAPEENPEVVKDLEASKQWRMLNYTDELRVWLEDCYQRCRSEKLRWFLLDFIAFVQTGGNGVVNKILENITAKYLLDSDENLRLGEAIYSGGFEKAKRDIGNFFVGRLREKVRQGMAAGGLRPADWQVGEKRDSPYWRPLELAKGGWGNRRVCIEAQEKESPFIIGVSKSKEDEETIPGLAEALTKQFGPSAKTWDWWDWSRPLDEDYRNWGNAETLARLKREDAVNRLADYLVGICKVAAQFVDPHLGLKQHSSE